MSVLNIKKYQINNTPNAQIGCHRATQLLTPDRKNIKPYCHKTLSNIQTYYPHSSVSTLVLLYKRLSLQEPLRSYWIQLEPLRSYWIQLEHFLSLHSNMCMCILKRRKIIKIRKERPRKKIAYNAVTATLHSCLPWPGFEPGLSRPQREVLTTIRSRLWLADRMYVAKIGYLKLRLILTCLTRCRYLFGQITFHTKF